jgi:hypothetical protein
MTLFCGLREIRAESPMSVKLTVTPAPTPGGQKSGIGDG